MGAFIAGACDPPNPDHAIQSSKRPRIVLCCRSTAGVSGSVGRRVTSSEGMGFSDRELEAAIK